MNHTLWIEISLASHELSGREALEIRNALEDQIDDSELAEVVGGGCAVDSGSCDLEVEATDLDAAEQFVRDLLTHCGLRDSSKIERRQAS